MNEFQCGVYENVKKEANARVKARCMTRYACMFGVYIRMYLYARSLSNTEDV